MSMRMRIMLAAVAVVVAASTVRAGVIVKANNTDALNLPTSWIGGVVPGTNDIAQWDYNVTSGQTYTLGTNLTWQGLAVTATCSNGFTFAAGNTLTLGVSGITTVPDKGLTFNCGLALAADQTWSIGANTFIPQGGLNMSGYTLSLSGGGVKQFKSAITGNGRLVNLGTGAIKFTGTSAAAPATDVELNADNITFETNMGLVAGPRTKSLKLNNGATVSVGGRTDMNTVETNANALTAGPGATSTGVAPSVTVTPNAAKNAQFYSGSFVRPAGAGFINFRGTGLGTNTLASLTANSVNVVFGTSPQLLGAGGAPGSKTISILPGAVADVTTAGTGIGLATYDAIYGLRAVNTNTECTAAVGDGQTQLDNVRLANSAGTGVVSNALTTATTVNALTFAVSGANTASGSGIALAGNATLTLNSGCIYANQNVSGQPTSGNVSNAMTIGVNALDLNGHEGVFIAYTATLNNSGQPSGGLLDIRSAITNDGGNGVTIMGTGTTRFSGSATNTYTGTTTVNSGRLWLMKTNANGVPGSLVLNGGTVEDQSNQIADSGDITINSGNFKLQIGNEGSSRSETYNNLIMNGGSYGCGSADHYGGSLINGFAVLAGGAMTMPRQTIVTVTGPLVMSGGTISVQRSQSTTLYNTVLTANGGLVISNLVSGAYTPITLDVGDSTHSGGKLSLNGGDVTFVGNADNTNTVTISAPAGAGTAGVITLTGTRTFNIGDGAAANDLTLAPILVNSVPVGGVTKTGAGTLSLTATNAYTGATTVDGGTLAVNGGLVSPITVNSGAGLAGTGWIAPTNAMALAVAAGGVVDPGAPGSVGTLTVTGNVSFAGAAVYRVNVAATSADRLAVYGTVSGGTASVEAVGTGTAPWLILTATEITGTFRSVTPGLVVSKRTNNTELWLMKNQGTLIAVH